MTRHFSVARLAFVMVAIFLGGAVRAETGPAATADKPVITRKDDLPRHSYQLDLDVVDLYLPENRGALLALADQVEADILADLAAYDIQDASTVQDLYGVLGHIAILEQRWQDYLVLLDKQRELESKAANRLTMGLYGEALARAWLLGGDVAAATGRNLQQALQALDYEVVQDNVKSAKGSTEILSRALVLGNMESSFQPIVDRTGGEVSYDIAATLLSASFTLDHFVPDAPQLNGIYTAYIGANAVAKADIWEQRQYDLAPTQAATPVVVAIWDSGLDTSIEELAARLWRNEGEIPGNNIDDDHNGFVDDVYGIAYDLHANKETSLLYPVGDLARDIDLLQRQAKGLGDLQSNVDSEEAAELRRQLAGLEQDQVKGFIESISLYGNYSHGTHVAGIAAQGNPFIRLLVARITFNHTMIPEEPTIEQARAEAQSLRETVAYFKANGVRAVNMSWGGSLRDIEDALEAHNAGGSPEARKQLAREIYAIGDGALREAISGAPDILFITSAGNSDNDVKFDEFYPSSYEYPNLITVGAVDQAGEETSFTSLGKVDVYGNGFEVESYVPGGKRIRYNGTSMSSPQVLNLAAKLLALDPSLDTAQLRRLILDGATGKDLGGRSILLLDPAASIALLQAQQEAGGAHAPAN